MPCHSRFSLRKTGLHSQQWGLFGCVSLVGCYTGVTWASVRDTDPCLSFLGRRCPIDLDVEVLSGWGSSGSGSYGSGSYGVVILRSGDLTEWIGPVADGMRIDRIPVGLVPEEDPATS
jgi:hypothetical protein